MSTTEIKIPAGLRADRLRECQRDKALNPARRRLVAYFAMSVCVCLPVFAQDSVHVEWLSQIALERGFPYCLATQGQFVFLGTGGDSSVEGLWSVNAGDSVHPYTAAFDTIYWELGALSISVSDTLAAIASAQAGVDLFDIRDPAAPRFLGNVHLSGGLVWGVAMRGHYVYAVRFAENGLSVIDISDPRQPTEVGFAAIDDAVSAVSVAGDYAYVAAEGGLHVVDIFDPTSPAEVAFVADHGEFRTVVRQNYVYATVYDGRMTVIDISDPRHPSLITHVITDGYADGIAMRDNLVFVAASEAGLQVYDVSQPDQPVRVGGFYNGAWPRRVAVNGNLLFTTADHTLQIYHYTVMHASSAAGATAAPLTWSLHGAYPNPFNASTTISFSLPVSSPVRVSVFDISGRLVQTLADQRLDAGERQVRFDGTNFSSGAYLVRMESAGLAQTQKILLVK